MRKLFISEAFAKSGLQAADIAPSWAEVVLRVDNGWLAFDSYASMKEFKAEQEEYSAWRKRCHNDKKTTLEIVEGK